MRITNRPTRQKYKLNLEIPKSNKVRFGTKSLIFGSLIFEVWNSLPYHIKSSENLSNFRTLIKSWNGTTCTCKICQIWSYIVSSLHLLISNLVVHISIYIKLVSHLPKIFFNEWPLKIIKNLKSSFRSQDI